MIRSSEGNSRELKGTQGNSRELKGKNPKKLQKLGGLRKRENFTDIKKRLGLRHERLKTSIVLIILKKKIKEISV